MNNRDLFNDEPFYSFSQDLDEPVRVPIPDSPQEFVPLVVPFSEPSHGNIPQENQEDHLDSPTSSLRSTVQEGEASSFAQEESGKEVKSLVHSKIKIYFYFLDETNKTNATLYSETNKLADELASCMRSRRRKAKKIGGEEVNYLDNILFASSGYTATASIRPNRPLPQDCTLTDCLILLDLEEIEPPEPSQLNIEKIKLKRKRTVEPLTQSKKTKFIKKFNFYFEDETHKTKAIIISEDKNMSAKNTIVSLRGRQETANRRGAEYLSNIIFSSSGNRPTASIRPGCELPLDHTLSDCLKELDLTEVEVPESIKANNQKMKRKQNEEHKSLIKSKTKYHFYFEDETDKTKAILYSQKPIAADSLAQCLRERQKRIQQRRGEEVNYLHHICFSMTDDALTALVRKNRELPPDHTLADCLIELDLEEIEAPEPDTESSNQIELKEKPKKDDDSFIQSKIQIKFNFYFEDETDKTTAILVSEDENKPTKESAKCLRNRLLKAKQRGAKYLSNIIISDSLTASIRPGCELPSGRSLADCLKLLGLNEIEVPESVKANSQRIKRKRSEEKKSFVKSRRKINFYFEDVDKTNAILSSDNPASALSLKSLDARKRRVKQKKGESVSYLDHICFSESDDGITTAVQQGKLPQGHTLARCLIELGLHEIEPPESNEENQQHRGSISAPPPLPQEYFEGVFPAKPPSSYEQLGTQPDSESFSSSAYMEPRFFASSLPQENYDGYLLVSANPLSFECNDVVTDESEQRNNKMAEKENLVATMSLSSVRQLGIFSHPEKTITDETCDVRNNESSLYNFPKQYDA